MPRDGTPSTTGPRPFLSTQAPEQGQGFPKAQPHAALASGGYTASGTYCHQCGDSTGLALAEPPSRRAAHALGTQPETQLAEGQSQGLPPSGACRSVLRVPFGMAQGTAEQGQYLQEDQVPDTEPHLGARDGLEGSALSLL